MSQRVHSDGYKCRGEFCSHADHGSSCGPAVSRADELPSLMLANGSRVDGAVEREDAVRIIRELEDLIERMRDDAGPVYESEQQLRDRVRALQSDRAALLAIVREHVRARFLTASGVAHRQDAVIEELIHALPEALRKEVTGG